jgi:hypothetical protein
MIGSSHHHHHHWRGNLAEAAAEPGVAAPDASSEVVPWMTTNGPLPTFALIRPHEDSEAAHVTDRP